MEVVYILYAIIFGTRTPMPVCREQKPVQNVTISIATRIMKSA